MHGISLSKQMYHNSYSNNMSLNYADKSKNNLSYGK